MGFLELNVCPSRDQNVSTFCLDGQIHDAQLVNRMGNWFVVAMFSHPRVEVES